jgi:UDP-GlcNAc:undecaprenyl-phosphate/decaprenyl-phosphate GlcNAc-1-phosphate transferase
MLYFIFSFFISIALIFLFIKFIKNKLFFDISKGDGLKIHKDPVSFLGGLAIFLSFFLGILIFSFFQKTFHWQITAIFLSALIIFLFGFWDDLRWKHILNRQPKKKLIILIICCLSVSLLLSACGIKVNFFGNIYLAGLLMSFYIFFFGNAVNYQDGMDGLGGGGVAISSIGFIILALFAGNFFILYLPIILLGALSGFLFFNFPPAKIFMGDSGAYFLGFMMAVTASFYSRDYSLLSIIGPILIIGLPFFEGIFSNIRRFMGKKSIFLGDREHFYDKLLRRGLSTKKVLCISYFIQLILAIIGIIITLKVI